MHGDAAAGAPGPTPAGDGTRALRRVPDSPDRTSPSAPARGPALFHAARELVGIGASPRDVVATFARLERDGRLEPHDVLHAALGACRGNAAAANEALAACGWDGPAVTEPGGRSLVGEAPRRATDRSA